MINSLANSRAQPEGPWLHLSRDTKRDYTDAAGTLKIELVNCDADDCDSLCVMAANIVSRTQIVAVCDVACCQVHCAASTRRHACIGFYTTIGYFGIVIVDHCMILSYF